MDQEDHQLLEAADVPQQVREVVVHQLEAQVVEVLQQVAREVDVHQLGDQAVDVPQQGVREAVVLQLAVLAVEVLQQGVREADVLQLEAQEVAMDVLQQVGLGVTCASVWMKKC